MRRVPLLGIRKRCPFSTAASNNYFKVLGLAERFELDSKELSSSFKSLQRRWHPDLHGTQSPGAQEKAATMSALVNQAYRTLRSPHERAQHLLSIKLGNNLEGSQTVVDPEFLTWVVSCREQISALDRSSEDFARLKLEVEGSVSRCLSSLSRAFEENQYDLAAEETSKLQYLRRMMDAIEEGEE